MNEEQEDFASLLGIMLDKIAKQKKAYRVFSCKPLFFLVKATWFEHAAPGSQTEGAAWPFSLCIVVHCEPRQSFRGHASESDGYRLFPA